MIPLLIGISGKSGVGKDTFGQMLLQLLSGPAEINQFSSVHRQISGLILGIPSPTFGDPNLKKLQLPKGLQVTRQLKTLDENTKPMWTEHTTTHTNEWLPDTVGDALSKAIHPDLWVWTYFNRYHNPAHTVILTDVRFKNEADEIKARGGMVIRLENQNLPHQLYLFDTPQKSQTELDGYPFDHIIYNDGSLEELNLEAGSFVSYWTHHDFLP